MAAAAAAAAAAQPEEQALQGVSRSGSTWYAHLTMKTSLTGGASAKFTVNSLKTQREAAHARDLLLLAKERMFGLSTHRHDQMHCPRSLYDALVPDLQRCSSMEEAASLITRVAERGELAALAQASHAAGMAPQVRSRPPSALLAELQQRTAGQARQQGEHRQQQQGQQRRVELVQARRQGEQERQRQERQRQRQDRQRDQRRQPQDRHQQQGQQQQQAGGRGAAAAAAAAAGGLGLVASSRHPAGQQLGQQRSISSKPADIWLREGNWTVRVSGTGREITLFKWRRSKKHWSKQQTGSDIPVSSMDEAQCAGDLLRLWCRLQNKTSPAAPGLFYPVQHYQAVMPYLQQYEDPKELALWLRSPSMKRRIAGLAAAAQLAVCPAQTAATAPAAAAPAAAPAVAASSGSSGPAGQRGRGHSIEALTARQAGPDVRLQRQHLRWEEEEEQEEVLRPPSFRQQQQQQQQQPTSPKGGKRHADDGQGGSLASKRPRVQRDEEAASQHEHPVQKKQQKAQHKSKAGQQDEDEQPAQAAQLGGGAELEPGSPGKKKRKKERQQQQAGQAEQEQEQQALQQQQQVAAAAERGRGPQPSGAAAAAAAAAAGAVQQAAALQPAPPKQPEAAQRAAAASDGLEGLPELPHSVPADVSSAWWALNQLRPHLEQRGVCDATQFSRFALHFVDADAEEQRGLYAILAGCLRAGDAAGAARWVRKYGASG